MALMQIKNGSIILQSQLMQTDVRWKVKQTKVTCSYIDTIQCASETETNIIMKNCTSTYVKWIGRGSWGNPAEASCGAAEGWNWAMAGNSAYYPWDSSFSWTHSCILWGIMRTTKSSTVTKKLLFYDQSVVLEPP